MRVYFRALDVLAIVTGVYAYAGYPALLALRARMRRRRVTDEPPSEWPRISITVPAYNEESSIAATLDRLLEIDYPADRRQILVISDASTDRTDEIVRRYADRGVELLRLPVRSGKTAAENASRPLLTGDIIVNTDASVRLAKDCLKPLIAAFHDPSVGVSSGRDVSVARLGDDANAGESGYVSYEMWLRKLETEVNGIVGASGCCYASRTELHREIVPLALSRDFAAPLIARENGYRSVSVEDAVCFVPRTPSLKREYRRKVRTMTRGLETLFYKRHLLDPFRYGIFAWMLWSHKLIRWLVPWAMVWLVFGVVLFRPLPLVVRGAFAVGVLACVLIAFVAMRWPERRKLPRPVAAVAYVVWGVIAGIHAWINAMRGELNPVWEPTRRGGAGAVELGDEAAGRRA